MRTVAQPIAIGDVIAYLVHALNVVVGGHAIFEIGGPRRVNYGELMREYARQIGVRRVLVPVPFLSPRLSSLWLGLVTPLYARVGRKLIDSMRTESVVNDPAALTRFPVRPAGVGEAIARALWEEDGEMARTRWSDAVSAGIGARRRKAGESGAGSRRSRWGGRRFGSRLVERQQALVPAASAAQAFRPIQRIGGRRGWYFGNWLWLLRGMVDLALGGVGMRRGRRHPVELRAGDPLDFWRVEAFEAARLLRLRAEMKVPGRAWLQFEVEPGKRGSLITQTAVFDPLGLWGLVYWYGLYPVHRLIFRGMLRGIVSEAKRLAPRPRTSLAQRVSLPQSASQERHRAGNRLVQRKEVVSSRLVDEGLEVGRPAPESLHRPDERVGLRHRNDEVDRAVVDLEGRNIRSEEDG